MTKWLLTALSIFPLWTAAQEDGYESLRRQIQQNWNNPAVVESLQVDTDWAEQVVKSPIGSTLVLPNDNGTYDISIYLGVYQNPENGRTIMVYTEETISAEEYRAAKSRGVIVDGPVQAGPRSEGLNVGPARVEEPGQASWRNGRFDRSAGNILGAGIGAGLATGVAKGLLVRPSDSRKLKELEQELAKAAAATAREQGALLDDLLRHEKAVGAEIEKFMTAAAQPSAASPLPNAERVAFHQSPAGQAAGRARAKMSAFEPTSGTQVGLKNISLASAEAAEESFNQGNAADAAALGANAELFADVALGLNPFTGIVKDGYEALTGHHSLTGRPLSNVERTLSTVSFAAGLATAGIASSAFHGLKITGRLMGKLGEAAPAIYRGAQDFTAFAQGLGLRTAEGWKDLVKFTRSTLGNEIGAVGSIAQLGKKIHPGNWVKDYDLWRVHSADQLNAQILAKNPAYKVPYKAGTQVFDGILKQDSTFVRLHGANNQQSSWLVKMEAIDKSLSPADLRLKYSLPVTPDFISEVTVRKGTLIRRSKVRSNFGGGENAIQYQVMDPLGNAAIFGPPRAL